MSFDLWLIVLASLPLTITIHISLFKSCISILCQILTTLQNLLRDNSSLLSPLGSEVLIMFRDPRLSCSYHGLVGSLISISCRPADYCVGTENTIEQLCSCSQSNRLSRTRVVSPALRSPCKSRLRSPVNYSIRLPPVLYAYASHRAWSLATLPRDLKLVRILILT